MVAIWQPAGLLAAREYVYTYYSEKGERAERERALILVNHHERGLVLVSHNYDYITRIKTTSGCANAEIVVPPPQPRSLSEQYSPAVRS